MMYALGFDRYGARRFVPLWPGFAVGEQALLELRDDLRVFAVGGDDHPEAAGYFQRPEELGVVDAEGPLVGEKHLERCRAVSDNALQNVGCLFIPARHTHVKR